MGVRIGQMALAVFGMVLLLRYGVVRDPAWGELTTGRPVHWTMHAMPVAGGLLCIVAALGLIFVREGE
jgi:hypothetical protein